MHQPSSTILRPPVSGVLGALAHAIALIASARSILNLSNIPARARLRHQLIAREHAEPKPTASLLRLRVLVEMLAERRAVHLPVVLIRRMPANEDRRGAVLVVLARLAARGGVFVCVLVFDAAVAGAVVRDAVERCSAPALTCNAVGANEVGCCAFSGLGHGGGGGAGDFQDGGGAGGFDGGPRLAGGDVDVRRRSSRDGRVGGDGGVVFDACVSPAFGTGVDAHGGGYWGAGCQGAEGGRGVCIGVDCRGVVDAPEWEERLVRFFPWLYGCLLETYFVVV